MDAVNDAWERYRAAIERRFSYPGPEADAEVRRLRDEFTTACGEPPIGANVVDLKLPRRRSIAA
jgi:hypothetical protein